MTAPGVEDRAVGAYVGLAIGDALGATVEFMTPREIRDRHGVHDRIVGGGWLRLRPGQVTDDTGMALALGQALLDTGRVDGVAIAEYFSEWMRGKPVDIGNTVRRGIIHYRHSGQSSVPPNEHDAGNGACMRILPVALISRDWQRQSVHHACRLQSHVTHNNPLSDAAALCLVEMLHLIMNGAGKQELLDGPVATLIAADARFEFRQGSCDNPSGFIVDTMRAVLEAFFHENDFRSCLTRVVNRGGDADTTGAIAGMLAGCYHAAQSLPVDWLAGLDPEIRLSCGRQALDLLAADIFMPQG